MDAQSNPPMRTKCGEIQPLLTTDQPGPGRNFRLTWASRLAMNVDFRVLGTPEARSAGFQLDDGLCILRLEPRTGARGGEEYPPGRVKWLLEKENELMHGLATAMIAVHWSGASEGPAPLRRNQSCLAVMDAGAYAASDTVFSERPPCKHTVNGRPTATFT